MKAGRCYITTVQRPLSQQQQKQIGHVAKRDNSLRHPQHYSSAVGTQYLEDSVRITFAIFGWQTLISPSFILNYKRLPYRTSWVEFSDVEGTLRAIGAQPVSTRSDGRPVYALPVIVDPRRPNTQPVVLSRVDNIAEYLETTYPARPVFPEGSRALQSLFVHYVHEVLTKPLLPILVPLSHQRLPERSQAHFPSAQAQLGPQEREQVWRAAKEQFNFLASILDKNLGDAAADGVVVMGHTVTYADFALCSVLLVPVLISWNSS